MSSNPALLDVDQAHTRHTEFSIVDVRTPGEYASGHLPGALNIPLDRIARSCPSCAGPPRTRSSSWSAPRAPARRTRPALWPGTASPPPA